MQQTNGKPGTGGAQPIRENVSHKESVSGVGTLYSPTSCDARKTMCQGTYQAPSGGSQPSRGAASTHLLPRLLLPSWLLSHWMAETSL